ncbi:MAG: DJ-1/PfpI/YhbO family deglycase/protease [Pseudomonadota bacterium]
MAVGEEGELIEKGPSVALGYLNRPEDTKDAFRDGWLYTGDLGTMDGNGFFYVTGRKKELIKYKGYNEEKMELEGKKIIILVEEMFNDLEFWYPYYRLKEAVAHVVVVGSGRAKAYSGKSGTKATEDVGADQISASEFDGIIIPGGYAPDHMRRYPGMVKLVKELFEAQKVVAAICHAGWMLASARILEGRKVTSFFAIKDDLIHAGANWVDEEVVIDGKLITSRRPDDLPAFMRAVIKEVM